MRKKVVSLFFVFLLMVSILPIHQMAYAEGPKLVIGRNTSTPTFQPGEDIRLGIPVENIGSESVSDVVISLDTSDLKNFPFVIDKMTTTKRISSIHGHSDEDVGFYLKVAMDAESKTYPIKVNMSYDSESGGGSAAETIYVKIEDNSKKPSLEVKDVKFKGGSVFSGQSTNMEIDLRNEGETLAKDIELKFEGLKANEIRLDKYMEKKKIQQIQPKHFETVSFPISASKELATGTYELELVMSYKDQYDHIYEKKAKVYVPVDGAGDQELDFSFEKLTYPKEGVKTGQDFIVAFDLKNSSDQDAKNVKVTVDGGEFILPKSASIKNIKNIAAGQMNHLEFKFFAKDGAESKNYPIQIKVEYGLKSSKAEDMRSMSQYVGVYVVGDNSKLTPKIIVDNYNFGGEYVKTGEDFLLNVSFYNTNKSNTISNIKVSLSSEGEIFTPVGSSNSFYIDEIKAKGHVQKTIKLKPKVDAEQKTYGLNVDIEYEDHNGKQYTAKENIGIPVVQDLQLMIEQVEIPPEVFAGTPTGISVAFYNTGRSLLRNVMIKTVGDFEIKDGNVYLGNLESGKDDYYDVTITPSKEGKFKGKIIFEYDDTTGKHYITEREFEINAMKEEMPPMPEDEMGMPEDGEKNPNKKWIIISIVGVGIAIVGFVFYRKRKKRKAEEVSIDE
ncbi:COG1361 S-layer family protein [Inediibacterium massiliense]|uniref:COG1361 S-layer family protein n=1 Tax=Inediibacterium massiliense TaxID=1658111 RepID=UPI0006B4C685|nr:hypothetical protein [Inediibacterium massiliense]